MYWKLSRPEHQDERATMTTHRPTGADRYVPDESETDRYVTDEAGGY